MEEYQRENNRLALIQRYSSAVISVVSFWAITLYWNWFSTLSDYAGLDKLELITRLGFSAALSWVVFLHAEVIGMIIMSMMKDKWQAEARAEAMMAAIAKAVTESEARAEAREARAEARAEAREARTHELILDLMRQLREARGEGPNGAEGGA